MVKLEEEVSRLMSRLIKNIDRIGTESKENKNQTRSSAPPTPINPARKPVKSPERRATNLSVELPSLNLIFLASRF